MIKNIVFDVGDVLIEYRWKQMLMDYGLSETDAKRVGDRLFNDPDGLWRQFDLGVKSDEEVIQSFENKYPEDAKAMRWFLTHGEYMPVARPHIWEMVHNLKQDGYKLFILSNYSESLFKKHTEYADFIKDMDGILVSYMIKEIKPNEGIYQELFRRFSIKPEDSIFFDDRLENVQASIACGMPAIQVHNKEQLLEELRKLHERR